MDPRYNKNIYFILSPYFVHNKYVSHTNVSPPLEDQRRPPRGAFPTVLEPLHYTLMTTL